MDRNIGRSPIPWELYRNMTVEDIRAIYRYLRTIKPITNRVPAKVWWDGREKWDRKVAARHMRIDGNTVLRSDAFIVPAAVLVLTLIR